MSTCLVSTTPEDFIVPYQLYGSNPAISIFVSGHTVARLYCGSPEIWCHPIKIAVYATFGAVLRTNGARCSCIRFHAAMSPSPSGSWWNATHTGPPTAANRVARSLAHTSPLPAAMSDHEYGSLKLTHGIRCAATSAFATATAEATCVGPQSVRRTPNGRPSPLSPPPPPPLPPPVPPTDDPAPSPTPPDPCSRRSWVVRWGYGGRTGVRRRWPR